ncbi:MAG: GNAT family N-acetyltransferase [Hyphomicrobiales bacterium]|nr:GNAT family N-acetyltransferase [Hyphomicrobiales bacterium]
MPRAAASAASPTRLLGRFVPPRRLPAGRVDVLPGIGVPLPVGPLGKTFREAPLGRIGNLEVRLARTVGEVKRAQELRYRVFYEEMSAIPDAWTMVTRRDADAFDAICDHILVLDHDSPEAKPFGKPRPRIVGTYRVLRRSVAERHDGFYSESEFDLSRLLASKPDVEFLELGRSCVLPAWRGKRTLELLWQGIWAYVHRHRIGAMIGCASLEGVDPRRLALPLSFLHRHCGADAEWNVRALPHRYVAMDRLSEEAIDPRAAMKALPPLIKGYLRVGAKVGDGAVVDHQFGTTDVFIVVPVKNISQRYVDFYGADGTRRAV